MDLDLVLHRIEQRIQRPLEPEETAEIQIWERGKRLSSIVHYPGWEDVEDMLRGYVTKAMEDLKRVEPWKREDVLSAHAVVFAADEIVSKFFRDVELSIQQGIPAAVNEAIKVPQESL